MRAVGFFKVVPFDEFYKSITEDEEITKLIYGEKDENFIEYRYYRNIKLPTRATVGSAGYDFFFPYEDTTIEPGKTIVVPTGIRAIIRPEDWFLGLYPKSGLSFNYKTRLDDTVGIIDRDYIHSDNSGHIYAKITNEGDKNLVLKTGSPYMQGIFQEFGLVDEDNTTKIRNGGLGSTYKI